uniref:LisH domain-containing protein n=1 Tax=Macrostomum lignano TaxID=282301 RepID=A0A1I8FQ66_9PLAT
NVNAPTALAFNGPVYFPAGQIHCTAELPSVRHGEESRRTPPPPDALNQQQWQPPSSARMKRAEPSSSGGGGPAAEESLMTVVQDMSRQLEEKADRLNLRSSSVRRIIKEVLSDQDVLDDVDLDADAVSASIQPSSQSQTQQQQPPPLLSTPPPSGAPLDDIGAVKAEDAAIFDEDDVEFRNFLRDIYLDRIEVADPPNEAEEDADFNVDGRAGGGVPGGLPEVRDLLDEICSDLFDSQLSAGRHLQQQAGASSPPQPLSQDDQEATAEPECLLQPCAVEDLSQEQRVELRKQLTMYVQLLCTMRITCHQQSPELADSAKVHLNELKLLADAYEAANPANTSILRVANLDGAVSLADNFAGSATPICYGIYLSNAASAVGNLFLTSSVFPYAPAVSRPACPPLFAGQSGPSSRPSEDRLLLLGLTQFGHRRDVFQLISKYTMPWRSQVAISARCVYLSKLQSLLFRDSLCPARVLTSGQVRGPKLTAADPKQSEPDSIDLNFCQSNWINSVPISNRLRAGPTSRLLFRQHLLLERPRLRGQLLKPTEPNPLERDTANDQANKLFKRCRILYATRTAARRATALARSSDGRGCSGVVESAAPQSLPRRRRGPAGQRSPAARPLADSAADATDFVRVGLAAAASPAALPAILDTASAECANQVKKKVKDYLLSRMRIKSGNFSSSDMPPQPPPQPPPPPPPPPPAVMAKSCRLILPQASVCAGVYSRHLSNCIGFDPVRAALSGAGISRYSSSSSSSSRYASRSSSPAVVASVIGVFIVVVVSIRRPTAWRRRLVRRPAATPTLPTDDAIAMAAPAAATERLSDSVAVAAASSVDRCCRIIPGNRPQRPPGPGESGSAVTDDLCESGGADDDRDIEFASAFLRCLRTELSSTPEAYWEALQTIGRLAETPTWTSFYRSALSAMPAPPAAPRSMLAGFVSVETALLVDALPDHLSVAQPLPCRARFTANCGSSAANRPLCCTDLKSPWPVGCPRPVQSPTINRLARLIDDLDTTFKYFPYCLSETLSQFPEVPNFAESRDAFEYVDLTSSQPSAATTASAAPSTEDFARRPRDSVFECLPESLGLHEDRFPEAQKSKESGSSVPRPFPGERRVLRHCDNCALVSRHHMLLVEKLESRRLRHYDYACVHFPPEFRPRSDLPPRLKWTPRWWSPPTGRLLRSSSDASKPTGGVGSGSSGGGGGASGRDNTGSGGGVGGGCGGQPRHRQQDRNPPRDLRRHHRGRGAVRGRRGRQRRDFRRRASSLLTPAPPTAVVEVESSTTTRCGPASAMTPQRIRAGRASAALFEPSRRGGAWLTSLDGGGGPGDPSALPGQRLLSGAFPLPERAPAGQSVRHSASRLLMRSYLAAQGAEYSTSDMDELSDCDE